MGPTMFTWAALAGLLTPNAGQTATVYRFESEAASGTVWVAGVDARREFKWKKDGAPGLQIEVSREAGKRLLVLNTSNRTYYDSVAYRAKHAFPAASVATLNVREPFVVSGVENVRIDLDTPTAPEATGEPTLPCRRVSLMFSYDLRLGLTVTDASFPGRVEGRGELCLDEALPPTMLPFGHGLELVSGIRQVDALLAERLAPLKGIPVRRTLTVTRWIEGGEPVSETSTLMLSDMRKASISGDRFEVPPGYRYQEPVIVEPVRREP